MADFPASDVWLQSFNLPDLKYWITNEPDFGVQTVYLDGKYCMGTAASRLLSVGADGGGYTSLVYK